VTVRAPRRLRVHVPGEPATLNPLRGAAKTMSTAVVASCVLHSLNAVDAHGRYRPQLLAAPPQPTPDLRTVEYRLRVGATWHDGRAVTASDVAFTHRVMTDPASDIPERDGYDLVEQVEQVDPRTVRLRLSRPYVSYRDLFTSSTGALLPAHLLDAVPFTSDWDRTVRPASGPFRLGRWDAGERIVLDAVAPAWASASGISGLELTFGRDTASQVDDLVAGRVDLIFPDPDHAALDAVSTSDVHWAVAPGEQWEQLCFRHDGPWTGRAEVREAVARVIDRDALAAVLAGAQRLDSLLHRPHHTAYVPSFTRYRRDVRRARAIAQSAGLRHVDGRLRDPSGVPVRLRLLVGASGGPRARHAQMLTAWVAELGIEVITEVAGAGELVERLSAGDFDLALFGYAGNPDPLGHATLWMSDPARPPDAGRTHGQNVAAYRSGRVTELLGGLWDETDGTRRDQLVAAADSQMAEDLPSLPLFVYPSFAAWRAELTGPAPYPYQAGPLWDAERWRLTDPSARRGPRNTEQLERW
jgi:peptide/nickel transport system substrate-binding protein